MKTNIDIDDELMASVMRTGQFKTKKAAVEAGLTLLQRQSAYREILKWEGKLRWDAEADNDRGKTFSETPVVVTGKRR